MLSTYIGFTLVLFNFKVILIIGVTFEHFKMKDQDDLPRSSLISIPKGLVSKLFYTCYIGRAINMKNSVVKMIEKLRERISVGSAKSEFYPFESEPEC